MQENLEKRFEIQQVRFSLSFKAQQQGSNNKKQTDRLILEGIFNLVQYSKGKLTVEEQ